MVVLLSAMLDLALPRECGGCGTAGSLWCSRCNDELAGMPIQIRPRVDPGVPCWALGSYSGPRRSAVLKLKERNRHDVARPLGTAVAGAVEALRTSGHIDPPELGQLVLIPAPSRARAARSRGGDPVLRFAVAAAAVLSTERVRVAPVLRMGRGVRDSVGLGAAQRAANVAGRIELVRTVRSRVHNDPGKTSSPSDRTVLLLDDVMTTGATAAESVCVLQSFGIPVDGVLVVAAV